MNTYKTTKELSYQLAVSRLVVRVRRAVVKAKAYINGDSGAVVDHALFAFMFVCVVLLSMSVR